MKKLQLAVILSAALFGADCNGLNPIHEKLTCSQRDTLIGYYGDTIDFGRTVKKKDTGQVIQTIDRLVVDPDFAMVRYSLDTLIQAISGNAEKSNITCAHNNFINAWVEYVHRQLASERRTQRIEEGQQHLQQLQEQQSQLEQQLRQQRQPQLQPLLPNDQQNDRPQQLAPVQEQGLGDRFRNFWHGVGNKISDFFGRIADFFRGN